MNRQPVVSSLNPVAFAYADLHDRDAMAQPRTVLRAIVCLISLLLASLLMLLATAPAYAQDALSQLDGQVLARDGEDDEGADDDAFARADDDSSGGGDSSGDGASASGGSGAASGTTAPGGCGSGDDEPDSGTGVSSDGGSGGSDDSGTGESSDGGSANTASGDSANSADSGAGDSEDVGDSSPAADCPVPSPGIDVQKDAAQEAVMVGDAIQYSVVVRNTGNVALNVAPTDAGCDGFDNTAFNLDPGVSVTLTCSHAASALDGSSYRNEACATGTPVAGTPVSDCDDAVTAVNALPPAGDPPPGGTTVDGQAVAGAVEERSGQLVAGERIAPGRARLLGPTGCARSAFNARVRGTRISRVTFVLDGKTIKRQTRPNSAGTFAVRINPAKLRVGVHRLVATVTFARGSGTRPRTLRLSFQRCSRALQQPRFTG